MFLKVTSGIAKGTKLKVPSSGTRPTLSRVREALFDILKSADRLDNARVLDAFAGSGALGIEALSRGAGYCLFLEKDHAACQVIHENIRATGLQQKAEVRQQDAWGAVDPPEPWDIVFLDPPTRSSVGHMNFTRIEAFIKDMAAHQGLRSGGIWVVEHPKDWDMHIQVSGVTLIDARTYGSTGLSFFAPES